MTPINLDHCFVRNMSCALVDPLSGDKEAVAFWMSLPAVSLAPSAYETRAGQFPWLVALDGLGDRQRDDVLTAVLGERNDPRREPLVALLHSDAALERIRIHLRRLIAPRFPGGREGVFRFYDPVVFTHLQWILDSRQQAALLGPIRTWYWPWRQHWHQAGQSFPPKERALHFAPGRRGWECIGRVGAIHAVLEHDPSWREDVLSWGARAETLLARAERHQLSERADVVAFAVQGLRWHLRLDEHPKVAQVLADSSGHPRRYSRLTGAWNDATWQAIVNELDATDPSRRPSYTLSQGVC